MAKRDYYEILGLSKSATDGEIKSAFRQLAKKYHPDVNKETGAEEKFKEIQEAYAVLSDPERKKQYDQFGHDAFNQGSGGGFSGFDFSDFDFSDIFGDLFGNSFGFNFGGRNNNSSRATKGRDSIIRMGLTFEEAIFGTEKEIKVDLLETCDACHGKGGHGEKTCSRCHGSGTITAEQRTILGTYLTKTTCPECHGKGHTLDRTCTTCSGTGRIKTKKTITVTVPAGVDNGNQLRIPGKGEAGANGGPNGDLYVEFSVKNHPIYQREEDDIYLELPISITDAVLGTKIDVPTLYGNVKLSIPSGSQSGDKHRLKGKGVENVRSKRKGDMYIVLNISIPKKLSKEQKDLFQRLDNTDLKNDSSFDKIKRYL
jgi:molecular chaperone DnaJ